MNREEALEIQAERSIVKRRVELYAFIDKQGGRWVADNVTFRQPTDGDRVGPIMSLTYEEAQTLIDELWRCGVRPTEGAGSAGSLAATERHLKDMQSIAKGLLKKEGIDLS